MIALLLALGGADLAWRPHIYASFTSISLLVQQAAVKFPVFCPRRFDGLVCPLCINADQFLFSCWSNNLEGLPSNLRHLPNGACAELHQILKTILFRLASFGSASD